MSTNGNAFCCCCLKQKLPSFILFLFSAFMYLLLLLLTQQVNFARRERVWAFVVVVLFYSFYNHFQTWAKGNFYVRKSWIKYIFQNKICLCLCEGSNMEKPFCFCKVKIHQIQDGKELLNIFYFSFDFPLGKLKDIKSTTSEVCFKRKLYSF